MAVGDEGHIQGARGQPLAQLHAQVQLDLVGDAGQGPAQGGDERAQPAHGHFAQAQPHSAGGLDRGLRIVEDRLGLVQERRDAVDKTPRLQGELLPPATALEQGIAQGGLQLFHARRNGWLRRVHALGRRGEGAQPGDPAQRLCMHEVGSGHAPTIHQ